jgi:LacI family transcriptional regulator
MKMSKRVRKQKKEIRETEIILMDVSWDCYFGRQVCRGVHRYARAHRPWVFINTKPYNNKWLGLLDRGFRNFGMMDYDKTYPSKYRGEAFVAALRRRGLTCETFDNRKRYPPCSESLPKVSDFSERACRWLASLPKPAAVFCINDALGVWVCDLCRRIKVHIPEEVAVLGADDDNLFCGMANPHLSSVLVPSEQVGYEAARLLDNMICGGKAPQRPVLLLPTGVATRQSTDVMAIDDHRVAEAVRYIRKNACHGIRVDNVMTAVSLPRRTLEKRFRKAVNRSPFAEIRRVQIERVKMLLAQTDKTLETIAPGCGFDGVTRMNMAFKQATDMTPGAYRRQFRSR